ncbi:class I SAM-dependent methyltransferase [Williamsia sterculiae]|nr:methyltransferase domain-containing protein [Williamsia sterculiae]
MSPTTDNSTDFWETFYAGLDEPTGLRPNPVLTDVMGTTAPHPSTALDLGCGHGGDAVWMASQGWEVTAVDVSATALSRVTAAAERAGVGDRVHTRRHDLGEDFPDGRYGLVSACYFHTPIDIPRQQILRRAAEAVACGGLLLIVEHASVAPWSWNKDDDVRFPTPDETLASLRLAEDWTVERCDAPQREATGPQGQRAIVTDNIVAVRRTR